MTTATLERMTIAEFEQLCDQDDYELIDGELKERAMGMEAAWVAGRFTQRLMNFNDEHELGIVIGDGAPLDIFGGRSYVPRPDTLFISSARHPSRRLETKSLEIAPELVLEVVSPSDIAYDIHRKVRRYLAAGVLMAWVAYPESRSVHVFRANGPTTVVEPPALLTADDILPGFSQPVADFFPEPIAAE